MWERVEQRRQLDKVRELLAGRIRDAEGLVAHNLDIGQFVQDLVETCEGPELLRALYKTLNGITVLDPTCGSGAFLFAALNVLEPLYEACLDRMQSFLDDAARLPEAGQGDPPYPDFRAELDRVASHPNRRYFILKSVIMRNLFGVDLMDEAVEICKLRLFLKLAAQVAEVKSIEPLPDIDFNVRAGNTLIGVASQSASGQTVRGTLGFG